MAPNEVNGRGRHNRRGLLTMALVALGSRAISLGESARVDPRYADRIRWEVCVLRDLGVLPLFEHAREVVDSVRQQGLVVGPGAGVTPNSLFAMELGLSGIDPIRHGLPFERFASLDVPDAAIYLSLALEPRAYERACERLRRVYGRPSITDDVALEGQASQFSGDGERSSILLWSEKELEGLGPWLGSTLDKSLSDPHIIAAFTRGDVDDLPGMKWSALLGRSDLPASETLRTVAPRSFDDVVAALAVRSGRSCQRRYTADFIRRWRSASAECSVLDRHPVAARALSATGGRLVFQEQITKVISETTGLSLGFSERLRRRMRRRAWGTQEDRELVDQAVNAAEAQGYDREETGTLLHELAERTFSTIAKGIVLGEVMLAWAVAARRQGRGGWQEFEASMVKKARQSG